VDAHQREQGPTPRFLTGLPRVTEEGVLSIDPAYFSISGVASAGSTGSPRTPAATREGLPSPC
jgi:hypothetical protein